MARATSPGSRLPPFAWVSEEAGFVQLARLRYHRVVVDANWEPVASPLVAAFADVTRWAHGCAPLVGPGVVIDQHTAAGAPELPFDLTGLLTVEEYGAEGMTAFELKTLLTKSKWEQATDFYENGRKLTGDKLQTRLQPWR